MKLYETAVVRSRNRIVRCTAEDTRKIVKKLFEMFETTVRYGGKNHTFVRAVLKLLHFFHAK